MKPHRFLKEADAEFREQIQYFDEQTAGLGEKFITDVASTVREIREYPEVGRQSQQSSGSAFCVYFDTLFST